jgi:hypothetical protein
MHYLYGTKNGSTWKLLATFDSEQQLLAYVRWATLHKPAGMPAKYEQGSALVGYTGARHTMAPLPDGEPSNGEGADVPHNPSPSML